MPYIKKELRPQYDNALDRITGIANKGDLEYCIFKLMKIFMADKSYCYENLHSTVYAAAHCADEFHERYLKPRETAARLSNGDIGPNIGGIVPGLEQ
jgi:hypothetical protein